MNYNTEEELRAALHPRFDFDQLVHVPLGTRCNSAGILNQIKLRQQSLPFDWIDTSCQVLRKLLQIDTPEMLQWLDGYLSHVDPQTARHPDGTWLPHDFPKTAEDRRPLEYIVRQYERRFRRLFDLFASGKNIVFLTVFTHTGSTAGAYYYNRLISEVDQLVLGSCVFVTINSEAKDCIYYHGEYNHYNLHVPFDDRYDFDDTVAQRLISGDERISQYFVK